MTQKSPEDLFDIEALAGEVVPMIPDVMNTKITVLGPRNPPVVIPEEPRPVTTEDEDRKADYTLARDTIRDVMEIASSALQGIVDVASSEGTPRSYEVAATLMKTISETAKDLLNVHKQMEDLKPSGGPSTQPPNGTTNIIDKAVFVGTTSDLLDKVRYPNG